jgi:hypothetical protein
MESIDRLLAELRAEYQASQKKREVASGPPVEAQPLSQPAVVPSNQTFKTADIKYSGTLDKDLAEIKLRKWPRSNRFSLCTKQKINLRK